MKQPLLLLVLLALCVPFAQAQDGQPKDQTPASAPATGASTPETTVMKNWGATNTQITPTGWQFAVSKTRTFSLPVHDPNWTKVNYSLPPLEFEPASIAKVKDFSEHDLAAEFARAWNAKWEEIRTVGNREAQGRINMVITTGKIAQGANPSPEDLANKKTAEDNLQKFLNFARDQKAAVDLIFAALDQKLTSS